MLLQLNEKAYLGPIGDDLPSLIPLMFALVIFFSSFYSTVSVYNDKTIDFENDISVVQISASLRGTGFVSSLQEFKDSCNALNIRQPYFSAGLVALDKEVNVFDLDSVYEFQGAELFKCSNTDRILSEETGLSPNAKIVSRVYPVVMQNENSVVVPVKLVVVAWRE
ncbi:MAG: hypothetical protein ABIJ74_04410 [archaeon]